MIKDILNNIFGGKIDLSYIVEPAPWVIYWDGQYLTSHLNQKGFLRVRTSTTHLGLRKQIIHFGSLGLFVTPRGVRKVHRTNKIIVSCFHLDPQDPRLSLLAQAQKKIDLIHTACTITQSQLIALGVPKLKIIVVPLGVDLNLFKPAAQDQKQKIRAKLKLPPDHVIIGSFQKDGIGWGKGEKPKLIKGPDILVQSLNKVKKLKPFVLLSGPSRAYVKQGLKKAGIPFRHIYLQDFPKIFRLYQALDCYLITSRVEGGPKAILEAWATGIPVVSTNVGMIPDIGQDETNVLIAPRVNSDALAQKIFHLCASPELQQKLIKNGLLAVQKFAWLQIARQYYQKLYRPLLEKNHPL